MTAAHLLASAQRAAEQSLKARLKAATAENTRLAKALAAERLRSGLLADLKASARSPKKISGRYTNLHKRLATPLLLCSDWHVGELVLATKVNRLNAYNAAEASCRARRLADAFVWLIHHHRTSFEIREAVLWAGGDLITGYLHPDQQQSNTLPPSHEVLLVQDLLGELIDKVLSIPGMERVTIPTSHGNHGRTSAKVQVATGAENSFEWLLYHQLRRIYAKESRVEFRVADGEFNRVQIHQTKVGFTHGDATKFAGGIGGLTVPVLRAITRWQTYGACDVWCMGHWHSYHDMPSLIVNGSLIGTAPFGMRVGGFEPPSQAFCLIDAKRGKCQSTPIWVARRPK